MTGCFGIVVFNVNKLHYLCLGSTFRLSTLPFPLSGWLIGELRQHVLVVPARVAAHTLGRGGLHVFCFLQRYRKANKTPRTASRNGEQSRFQ